LPINHDLVKESHSEVEKLLHARHLQEKMHEISSSLSPAPLTAHSRLVYSRMIHFTCDVSGYFDPLTFGDHLPLLWDRDAMEMMIGFHGD
jgi:hypothetical protein